MSFDTQVILFAIVMAVSATVATAFVVWYEKRY